MTELLFNLLQAVIIAAVPTLTAFLVNLISTKKANAKSNSYLLQIADAVATAVSATSQTYVDNLKQGGIFSAEEQRNEIGRASCRERV